MRGEDRSSEARYGVGVPKPEGGFVLIPSMALLAAWWAYRCGVLRLYDLRVWLACFEILERRRRLPAGRVGRPGLVEWQKLVGGVGGEHVRRSLTRLAAAGLLRWANGLPHPGGDATSDEVHDAAQAAAERAEIAARRVPVPRRTLQYLAGSSSRALLATVLGHILRCCFYRGGLCYRRGTCKASSLAEAFAVDVRSVKRARAALIEVGWLKRLAANQRTLNRNGAISEVNLDWREAKLVRREMTPPREISTSKVPPPKRNTNLSSRISNPEPAARGPTGVCSERNGKGKPTLWHVTPDDLQEVGRLLVLHEEAVRRGVVGPSENERLNFVAAAEHALRRGTVNPPGLFMDLVRNRRWTLVTNAEEDAAHRRLKCHFRAVRGCDGEGDASVQRAPRSRRLSHDEVVVAAVKRAANLSGYRGDLFWMARQVRPEWGREQWESAVAAYESGRVGIARAA